MSDKFAHLHVHSGFSVDGTNSPLSLLSHAKSLGQKSLALTEHHTMASQVEFAAMAKKQDMKAISGCEFYLSVDDTITHITAIGNGVNGYNNLVKILNAGVLRSAKTGKNYHRHPVLIDDLIAYKDDVIILSGCPSSPAQIKYSSYLEGLGALNRLKAEFDDRLFIELMLSGEGDLSEKALERSFKYMNDTKIKGVLTNDVHYAQKKDRDGHQFVMKSVGYTYEDSELYLKSREELKQFGDKMGLNTSQTELLKLAMDNAYDLSEKLDGIEFKTEPQLPYIEDSDKKLYEQAFAGLNIRAESKGWSDDFRRECHQRLDYELGVLKNKGFSNYFLLTNEFMRVARENGVVGYGRGSAAGSMAAYCLFITDVNPLEYDTLFERFINPERESFPDVDMDMSSDARDFVINYAKEKYGALPITTHTYHTSTSLLNDLQRVYNFPDSLLNDLKSSGLNAECWDTLKQDYTEAYNAYHTCLNENIRHEGKHAAGIVIIPDDVEYEIPLTIRDGIVLAEFSEGTHGQNMADAGGVKFDILGLNTLSVIEKVQKMTGVDIPEITRYGELEGLELIYNDDVDGIFQLSGDTALNYAKRFEPKNLNDLIYITSLARTGAIESGASDEYLKYRGKSGYPKVKALPPLDKGNMVKIEFEDGKYIHVYDHWEVKLVDGSYKVIELLESGDLLEKER